MALSYSGVQCELREVVLKNKPEEMVRLSPKATVPVLLLGDGQVIDESLDIMLMALRESDPEHWLDPKRATIDEMLELIDQNDSEFKIHLDRYKYPERFLPDSEQGSERLHAFRAEHLAQATLLLSGLDQRLKGSRYLFGSEKSLADAALFPFVRQFAAVDRDYFESLPLQSLQLWHDRWLDDPLFTGVMKKYKPWQPGDEPGHSGDGPSH